MTDFVFLNAGGAKKAPSGLVPALRRLALPPLAARGAV